MNDLTNTRNDLLRREQMMTQAWRDERRERQLRDVILEEWYAEMLVKNVGGEEDIQHVLSRRRI